MFRAIGFVILLYAVTNVFSEATSAFQNAVVATFGAVETAAEQSTTFLAE